MVCIGDWSRDHSPKFQEPTKGKSVRRLFRRAGLDAKLVDECRTSKRCLTCESSGSDTEKFMKVKNPRVWRRRDRPEIVVHGLLRCKVCSSIWNRDVNGSKNIFRIAECAIAGEDRPFYLRRGA